jgi:hypothetical protein
MHHNRPDRGDRRPELLDCQVARIDLGDKTVSAVAHLSQDQPGDPHLRLAVFLRFVSDEEARLFRFPSFGC